MMGAPSHFLPDLLGHECPPEFPTAGDYADCQRICEDLIIEDPSDAAFWRQKRDRFARVGRMLSWIPRRVEQADLIAIASK